MVKPTTKKSFHVEGPNGWHRQSVLSDYRVPRGLGCSGKKRWGLIWVLKWSTGWRRAGDDKG